MGGRNPSSYRRRGRERSRNESRRRSPDDSFLYPLPPRKPFLFDDPILPDLEEYIPERLPHYVSPKPPLLIEPIPDPPRGEPRLALSPPPRVRVYRLTSMFYSFLHWMLAALLFVVFVVGNIFLWFVCGVVFILVVRPDPHSFCIGPVIMCVTVNVLVVKVFLEEFVLDSERAYRIATIAAFVFNTIFTFLLEMATVTPRPPL